MSLWNMAKVEETTVDFKDSNNETSKVNSARRRLVQTGKIDKFSVFAGKSGCGGGGGHGPPGPPPPPSSAAYAPSSLGWLSTIITVHWS